MASPSTITSRVTLACATARCKTRRSDEITDGWAIIDRAGEVRASDTGETMQQRVVNASIRCDALDIVIGRIATVEPCDATARGAHERHRRRVRNRIGFQRNERIE